jgi:hypothetical protein
MNVHALRGEALKTYLQFNYDGDEPQSRPPVYIESPNQDIDRQPSPFQRKQFKAKQERRASRTPDQRASIPIVEKKVLPGTYYPFKDERRDSPVIKVVQPESPKRMPSPAALNFSDRRQSVKQIVVVEEEKKQPEIIEVVKTIKYEPEPDYETIDKVKKLEETVKTQQKEIDDLYNLIGKLR